MSCGAGQSHRSDPRILNRRTLRRDHPRLIEILRPGMSVLDVGCGTGAITADIARVVGPEGRVLGIDRDASLLAMGLALARREHDGIPNLSFALGDILALPVEGRFDVVTAARTLQWISSPDAALAQMKGAAKTGGWIVALDYNHENNSWEPDPPVEFTRFYRAFLEWRRVHGWSNRMADGLPELFRSQGVEDIVVHRDDEVCRRGEPDFLDAAAIWTQVAETVGPQLVAEGFLSERERDEAESVYREWARESLEAQRLEMRTVVGRAPW